MNEERAARNHFRLLLASAHSDALADAEGAEGVLFAIESFGRFLHRSDSALERTSPALIAYVARLPGSRDTEFRKRLALLRRGRNERVVRPAEGGAPSELVGIITPSDVA
jgi:hypothetical protein